MKYQITSHNLLYKGEMTRIIDDNDREDEVFVLYDSKGKIHYTSIFATAATFRSLKKALEYQKKHEVKGIW